MHLPVRWPVRRAHRVLSSFFPLIAGLFGAMFGIADCHAGSFAVSPTRIELSDAQSRAMIQIDNPTTDPITVQLKMMAWTQSDGKDQLRPSRDILATPQIVTIPPGTSQIVRIGALRKSDVRSELAYRLQLDEIPAPAPPDFKGLQVVLKVSLPVFLQPVAPAQAKLETSLSVNESKQVTLRIANKGNASAHLRDVSLLSADATETVLATYASGIYVLAGQQRTVVLKPATFDSGKKYLIKAGTPSGPTQLHAITVPQ